MPFQTMTKEVPPDAKEREPLASNEYQVGSGPVAAVNFVPQRYGKRTVKITTAIAQATNMMKSGCKPMGRSPGTAIAQF